jgi:hypothetical protein
VVASRWCGLGLTGAALAVSAVVPAPPTITAKQPRLVACDAATVVGRATAYLSSAAEVFTSVVATEDYRQHAIGPPEPERPALPPTHIREDLHVPPAAPPPSWSTASRRHQAAFLLLRRSDDTGWLGFRAVRHVDGRAVDAAAETTVIGEPALAEWRRRSEASARHHLGPITRRVNLPTAALVVLHAAHHARFTFAAAPGADRASCQVRFQELEEPSIVQSGIDDDVPASGAFQIDEATGRVISSELFGANRASGVASKTTVRFGRDPQLQVWVPREMREEFVSRHGDRLRGVATYSGYRTVEVTARIRPDR